MVLIHRRVGPAGTIASCLHICIKVPHNINSAVVYIYTGGGGVLTRRDRRGVALADRFNCPTPGPDLIHHIDFINCMSMSFPRSLCWCVKCFYFLSCTTYYSTPPIFNHGGRAKHFMLLVLWARVISHGHCLPYLNMISIRGYGFYLICLGYNEKMYEVCCWLLCFGLFNRIYIDNYRGNIWVVIFCFMQMWLKN